MTWFLLLLCGFMACAGQDVKPPCPLEMNPPAILVPFKGNFSVTCTSKITDIYAMGWETTSGGKLIPGNTSITLHINNLTEWDTDIKCYIVFKDESNCLEDLPFTMYKMMDSVSLSQLSQAGLVEGETYPMRCDVFNVAPARSLTVSWHKGNKILYTETFSEADKQPVNKSSIKYVSVDRSDHGVHLWCEAKLTFPQTGLSLPSMASAPRRLTVSYPPAFINPAHEEVKAAAQGGVKLNCTATGNPEPMYIWQHPAPTEQTHEDEPILAPSFVVPGNYNCTATNIYGSRTKTFTVNIDPGDRTTMAAIIGVFTVLGVALLVAGPFIVSQTGAFSLSRGSYVPASSGPV